MRIYTTKEVAEILGVSAINVRKRCQVHGLGQVRGSTRILTDEDVEFLRSRRNKTGRPKQVVT